MSDVEDNASGYAAHMGMGIVAATDVRKQDVVGCSLTPMNRQQRRNGCTVGRARFHCGTKGNRLGLGGITVQQLPHSRRHIVGIKAATVAVAQYGGQAVITGDNHKTLVAGGRVEDIVGRLMGNRHCRYGWRSRHQFRSRGLRSQEP